MLEDHFAMQIPHSDPTDHTRLRTLITKAFTARMVEALQGRIQELVDDLLDGVEEKGRMDVIWDFAFPLPASRAATIGMSPLVMASISESARRWPAFRPGLPSTRPCAVFPACNWRLKSLNGISISVCGG